MVALRARGIGDVRGGERRTLNPLHKSSSAEIPHGNTLHSCTSELNVATDKVASDDK